MESKLLYSFPEKVDRITERNNKIKFLNESKKAKRKMFFSSFAGLLIIAIAIFAPISWFKIPIALIGVYSIFISYAGYKFQIMSLDSECYTKIYSDRIEHLQYDFFKNYKVLYNIEYNNILSCRENYLGYLEIKLENSSGCAYVIFPDGRKPVNCKNNLVVLNFQDYNTKQFIKINMKNEFKVEN